MVKVSALMFYYIVAWVLLATYWMVDVNTWVTGLILGWFFHMIVCSVILHKYFTHRTYKVNKLIHWLFTYLGSLSLNGSVLAWSNMHRLHHVTSDRDGDPHNPRLIGFWSSLFVLKGFKYSEDYNLVINLKYCKDLVTDKAVSFFHRNLFLTITLTYGILWLLSYKALVILLIATAVSFIGLFFTTYVYHFNVPILHYRNNETKDKSYNNWLTTILFPGEAYHNNHHNDASKYNTAEKWFEFDLSSLLIRIIKKD